eukprot:16795-Pelagomonas_calceolata.AAC.2
MEERRSAAKAHAPCELAHLDECRAACMKEKGKWWLQQETDSSKPCAHRAACTTGERQWMVATGEQGL